MASYTFDNQRSVEHQVGSQVNHGPTYMSPIHNYYGTQNHGGFASNDKDSVMKAILDSLAFQGMLDRRNTIHRPHDNTCEWIFSHPEYIAWQEKRNGLLWIKGKPGSGKSTIMSVLYRRLRSVEKKDSPIFLEFFFSARGSELQHSAIGMFRSLLNQVLRQNSSIGTEIEASFLERQATFGNRSSSWEWQEAELEQLLTTAIIETAREYRTVVFIDALDEAGACAKNVLQYWHRLDNQSVTSHREPSRHTQLKICLSSRNYPFHSKKRSAQIRMEDHNRDDLKQFIFDELHEDLCDDGEGPSEWNQFRSDILERAKGVFQWAKTVVGILLEKFPDGMRLTKARRYLDTLPSDLKDIYKHILERVIDPEFIQQSFQVLMWVCLRESPLSPRMILSEVLSDTSVRCEMMLDNNEAGRMRRIVALSGGLLETQRTGKNASEQKRALVDSDEEVHVIHETVRDYLIKEGFYLLSRLCTDQKLRSSSMAACDEQGELHKDFETLCAALQTPAVPNPTSQDTGMVQRCHTYLYHRCLKLVAQAGQYKLSQEGPQTSPSGPTSDTTACFDDSKDNNSIRKSLDVGRYFPMALYAYVKVFMHAKKSSCFSEAGNPWNLHDDQDVQELRQVWPYWIVLDGYISVSVTRATPEIGWSLLHIATAFNLEGLFTCLLRQDSDINQQSDLGRTALHIAVISRNLTMCKKLLQAGAQPNMRKLAHRSIEKSIPIVLETTAMMHPFTHLDIIKQPEDNAEDGLDTVLHTKEPCQMQSYYNTPLQEAVHGGNEAIVNLLLEAGADVNAPEGEYGTALHCAANSGQEVIVYWLLQKGANVHSRSRLNSHMILGPMKMREGTMSKAWRYFSKNTFSIKTPAGRVPGLRNGGLVTSLQIAALGGHTKIVKMLIVAGANANAEACTYGTALHLALLERDRNSFRERFLEIIRSKSLSKSSTVKLLLNHGADVNAQGCPLGSTLQVAIMTGEVKVVQRLLEAGADVHAQAGCFGTCLQAAVLANKSLRIELQEAYRVKEKRTLATYETIMSPLDTEANDQIFKILVDAGADPTIQLCDCAWKSSRGSQIFPLVRLTCPHFWENPTLGDLDEFWIAYFLEKSDLD